MSESQNLGEAAFIQVLKKCGAQVYLVGGSLRDRLLNQPQKDYDLLITHLPQKDLMLTLKPFGHVNLVGASFGIIKFYPHEFNNLEIDLALPRTEASCGELHRDFNVEFDPFLPVATDLKRRDFTINAMAQNIFTGEILDPFHGRNDLENKILRTVFDNAFVEDPLRMLRAVQFMARFELTVCPHTKELIRQNVEKIRTVATERIMIEIQKLFVAPKPSVGFDFMRSVGLLPLVFPDIQQMIGVTQPNKNNEDVYTHTMKVLDAARSAEELGQPGDLHIMFAALFHDAGKPKTKREDDDGQVSFHNHQHISTGIAWRWLKDFRATTIGLNPEKVCHLVQHHMFETKPFENNEKAIRRFINKVGPESIMDLLDLRLADKKGGRFPKKVFGILKLREQIKTILAQKPPFTPKDLALNGHEIIQLGFTAGPVIGKIQKFLMELVLDDPSLNNAETLAKLIELHKIEFI